MKLKTRNRQYGTKQYRPHGIMRGPYFGKNAQIYGIPTKRKINPLDPPSQWYTSAPHTNPIPPVFPRRTFKYVGPALTNITAPTASKGVSGIYRPFLSMALKLATMESAKSVNSAVCVLENAGCVSADTHISRRISPIAPYIVAKIYREARGSAPR